MKKILPVILFSLIIASCTTMPSEIEDKYLAEKTEPQSKAISALEQKIIDKNKEKQSSGIRMKETANLPGKTEEEVKLLEKENDILKDQIVLYEKNKDAVNLEAKKVQLADNESKLAKKRAILQYQESEKKLAETENALKDTELAQYIAELNLEKSKIAAVYRDKTEQATPEAEQNFLSKLFNPKDPNDKYGYKKYSDYLEKKKEEKSKAEAEYREAEKKFLDAKVALDKTK